MERILIRNIESIEGFLAEDIEELSENDELSLKGLVISALGFCNDAFNQICADNDNSGEEFLGFKKLDEFLKNNPDRDINKLSFDEISNIARGVIDDKTALLEFFKSTKRVHSTPYELF